MKHTQTSCSTASDTGLEQNFCTMLGYPSWCQSLDLIVLQTQTNSRERVVTPVFWLHMHAHFKR